jgi:diaminopimelate epimerase
MIFSKYHALGNDYLVLDPKVQPLTLTPERIRTICDRHYGVGSDGILIGPLPSAAANFALRIYNPDGSEAEKSGNGLRIFCRYLWDRTLVSEKPFSVETKGGHCPCRDTEQRKSRPDRNGEGELSEQGHPGCRRAA